MQRSLESPNTARKVLSRLRWSPLNLTFMEYATLMDVILAVKKQPVAAKVSLLLRHLVNSVNAVYMRGGVMAQAESGMRCQYTHSCASQLLPMILHHCICVNAVRQYASLPSCLTNAFHPHSKAV